ncbi:MAG: Calx-beta domain-containing protein [Cyanobacteria bacterium J06633_8]
MLDSENMSQHSQTQFNYAYLIDVSNSFGEDALENTKDAYIGSIQSLIDRGIADDSNFAVIPFGSDAPLHGPLNATEAISKIKSLSGKNGFTNFKAALDTANEFYSMVPSGGENITYFTSDGFSTIGGNFKESAEALHKVANVRAYGFGAANIQDLAIIDSDQPVIVNEASQLATRFIDDMGGLVADKSQNTDSQVDGNDEIEVASPPGNEAVQDNSLDTGSEQNLKTEEENLVDDSVSPTPPTSIEPEDEIEEVVSPPGNEAVQDNSLDTGNKQNLKTEEENLVDDSVSPTPPTPIEPGDEIEVVSPPGNEVVQDNSLDTGSEQNLKTGEENLVDDSISPTPPTSIQPGIDNGDDLGLGSKIDGLTDVGFPILNVEDVSIKEGNIGSSIAQFVFNLSAPATEEIQFSYQTVDGSAISGSDYNQASGQITIPTGETSAAINIIVNGDPEIELDEEFTLNLNNLSSATFANNETEYNKVAVIENDDVAQSSAIIPQNEVQTPQLQDDGSLFEGNLLDLQSFTDEVAIKFTLDREAIYDSVVGFYKVKDIQGTITDPVTGEELKPSDGEAYAKLAIGLREPELELSVEENQSSVTIEDSLFGGHFYAPFIVADGDFSQFYLSFAQGNSDKAEHVRSLGNNTLAFEDMWNGGDKDFNDIVIQTEVKTI